MIRMLSVCALLIAITPAAPGQQKPAANEHIVRLTVSPAAAPKPALKYQLLPELSEMNPGNPVLGYLKCFSEQNYLFHNKQGIDFRTKCLKMPLKDLPLEKLRDYGDGAAHQANYAARLNNPDWQVLIPLKRDGIYTLVPEIQQMGKLALVLKLRFRGAVASHRFDDALVTAKTMFALSRHLAEHPTPIGFLVGNSIANIAADPLEEMIQQPGCPNLFWALTDLPSPLFDLHKTAQGERLIWRQESRVLNEKRPMTEKELEKAVTYAEQFLGVNVRGVRKGAVKTWLDEKVKDAAFVRASRRRLKEAGLPEKSVKKFPPSQVVMLDAKYAFDATLDDMLKVMQLPYWQAEKTLMRVHKGDSAESKILNKLIIGPLAKVRMAQVRTEQRFAVLRHIEALRMYAAEHQGTLPMKLNDIDLPLPVDPVTGRPLQYSVNGATATLRGGVAAGMENNPAWNRRYEITIRK